MNIAVQILRTPGIGCEGIISQYDLCGHGIVQHRRRNRLSVIKPLRKGVRIRISDEHQTFRIRICDLILRIAVGRISPDIRPLVHLSVRFRVAYRIGLARSRRGCRRRICILV